MSLDPAQGKLPDGFRVPRGSMLNSRPVGGVPCVFRTAYDTTLWPIAVEAVEWVSPDGVGAGAHGRDAVAAIRLGLRAFDGVKLGALSIDALRLHLAGDVGGRGHALRAAGQQLPSRSWCATRTGRRAPPVLLGPKAVFPVGFGEDEAMLPYPTRTFAGYSLLQELFAFPEKFHFVDLLGFGEALRTLRGHRSRGRRHPAQQRSSATERRQAVELGLTPRSFRVGCTPAVNLFQQSAEPILLTGRSHEHLVVPDARRRLEVEVWSVDR